LGYLTAALNGAGFDATGLDISMEAVTKATERFGPYYEQQDVFDPDPRLLGAFDFVIVLETLEHVPDPKAFLAAISRHLKPGGSLLVTTPNRNSHPSGAQWRTDPPPVHLYWLTESALVRVAEDLGFDIELVDFSEFNDRHYQTVALGNLSSTPPAMLNESMQPCATIPMRTQFMERVRDTRLLSAVCRRLYDGLRPRRARLHERSFSIAAVLSPSSAQ
jgi:SAM-dependent methyltransferase